MSSSGKQPYQPPPKYINEFSKALAGEVRILLAEVGKLRDERRQLQHEIAELMAVKSKHGAGGEYTPDWQPPTIRAIEEAPPSQELVVAPPDEQLGPARPAWRTVHKGTKKKERAMIKSAPAPTPPPAPAPLVSPSPSMPAWTQWRPNPHMTPFPIPPSPSVTHSPPPRSGLFGPSTPPPK